MVSGGGYGCLQCEGLLMGFLAAESAWCSSPPVVDKVVRSKVAHFSGVAK